MFLQCCFQEVWVKLPNPSDTLRRKLEFWTELKVTEICQSIWDFVLCLCLRDGELVFRLQCLIGWFLSKDRLKRRTEMSFPMIPVNISLSSLKGRKSFPMIWDSQCFWWTHFRPDKLKFKFGMIHVIRDELLLCTYNTFIWPYSQKPACKELKGIPSGNMCQAGIVARHDVPLQQGGSGLGAKNVYPPSGVVPSTIWNVLAVKQIENLLQFTILNF